MLKYVLISIVQLCSTTSRVYFLELTDSSYQNATSFWTLKIVNEYDQEIPQSQTTDNPVAPRGRAAQPSRDTRKTN